MLQKRRPADIAMQIDPETAETFSSSDIHHRDRAVLQLLYVMFRQVPRAGELLDLEVRQANGHAIDYQGAIDFTVGGEGGNCRPADPERVPPARKGLPMPEENLERAREPPRVQGLRGRFPRSTQTVASLNVYGVDLTR